MAKHSASVRSPEDLLHHAGIVFDRLEDVPAKVVREVMQHNFANMRSIELPPSIIGASLKRSLLGDLLVTRIGYSSPSHGHYIPRPEGSLDHILIHCVHGLGWLEMGDRRWKVDPDTVVCIPAGVPHRYGADRTDPWSIYWLHVTGAQAPGLFVFLGVDRDSPLIYLPHSSEVLSAFEATWAAMKAVHTWEKLVQASIRAAYFLGLVRQFQRSRDPRRRAGEEAIRQSIAFMTNNLGADVSLIELAELADMSVSRYTAGFRQLTNCSPVEYFNRLRIQKACELLRSTTKSVREIGRDLGFADPYYFSHSFKKIAGVSPEKFRNR
ncbi:MAG: helix-turn-helix domain-containing protein [Thermoguttaceae bacterium]